MLNGLAYCIYGNFEWPPAPHGITVKPEAKAPGCIVIRYLKSGDLYRGWMAWVPATELESIHDVTALPNPSGDGTENYLFAKSKEENIWEDFKRDRIACYWLDKVEGKSWNLPRVMFAGAALLERYDLNDENKLAFRLPLAREYAFANVAGKTSRVIFGQPKNPYLRFDLGISVPFVQRNTKGQTNDRVFPFSSLLYLSTENDPLQSIGITLGAHGASSELNAVKLPPKNRRAIGQFGFAIQTPKKDNPYATLTDKAPKTKTWPLLGDDGVPVTDHFKRLGFLTAGASKNNFVRTSHLSNANPSDLGFEFTKSGGLTYRLQQEVSGRGSSEDIAAHASKLKLRLRHDLGAWLDTDASEITSTVEVTWNQGPISPSKLGAALLTEEGENSESLNSLLSPEAKAKMHWQQTFDEKLGSGHLINAHLKKPPSRDTETNGLIHGAIVAMRHARLALQQAEGAKPQSFLPELKLMGDPQKVRMVLHARSMQARFDRNGLLEWRNSPRPGKSQFRLTIDEDNDNALALRAWFPSASDDVPPEKNHAHVKLIHDPGALTDDGDDQVFASYLIVNDHKLNGEGDSEHIASDHSKRVFSLGALRLQSDGAAIVEGERNSGSRLAISRGRVDAAQIGIGRPAIVAPLGVEISLRLRVTQVLPRSVDLPRSTRADQPAPILISIKSLEVSEPDDEANYGFILDVNERIGDRRDWQMAARLSDNIADTKSSPIHHIVLSEEPMSLLRFSRQPLSREGDASSTIVAEYDNLSRAWQFRNTGSYRYTLPAQSIGEGADKPRRLELHDLKEGEIDSHRPYPMDDGRPRKNSSYLVDFRLTPPADVWINPSDVERSFVLPEWSAHEIFRQRGAFGLGVGLQGLRAEFLYGLSVGVNTGRETGSARLARVAEIEALTGEIVDRSATTAPYEPLDKRWKKVQRALRRRPERLEVWTLDARATKPFAAAKFHNASFALRRTALHRPPITSDSDRYGSDLPRYQSDAGPRHHDQGLGGGALWPLESRPHFDRLLLEPDSIGGTIERLALSPLGGDADQSAGFLDGNMRITSQTRNGRVQRQRVEIMGRIATFWHRAKHVVVYERTVNASDQFAPEDKEAAKTRTRRPVLRKVAEFIELIEPHRSYPDVKGASARSCGFLDSVRFNSRIIYVDSAWSQDVGKIGWKIPLWNRYAARRRPRVYPRPDIAFVTVGEGEGDRPRVAQECRDPENIWFYAEATPNADTDTWSPQLGVDFADVPDAGDLLKAIDVEDPGEPDQYDSTRAKNASRILPGYRRFTWFLVPAGAKTRINAERGQKPIFAGLESISFMRAALAQDNEQAKNVGDLLKIAQNFQSSIENNERPPLWSASVPPNGIGTERKLFDQLKTAVTEGNSAAATTAAQKLDELYKPGKFANDLFPDSLDVHLYEGLKGKGLEALIDKVGSDFKQIGGLTTKCSSIGEDFVKGLQRKKRLFVEQIRDVQADIKFETMPDNKAGFIKLIVDQITGEINDILSPATADLGNLRSGIETARAAIQDAAADMADAIRHARRRIGELIASYDNTKPWSEARVEELLRKVSTEIDGIWGDIDAAIAEARQRLATELDASAQRIGDIAARLLRDIAAAEFDALKRLQAGQAAVDATTRRAMQALEAATPKLEQARAKIAEAAAKGKPSNKTRYDAALKLVDTALTEANMAKTFVGKDLKAEATRQIGSLRQELTKNSTVLTETITNAKKGLLENVDLLAALNDDGLAEIQAEIETLKVEVGGQVAIYEIWLNDWIQGRINLIQDALNPVAALVDATLREAIDQAAGIADNLMAELDDFAGQLLSQVAAAEGMFAGTHVEPSHVAVEFGKRVIRPGLVSVFTALSDADFKNLANDHRKVQRQLDLLVDTVEEILGKLDATVFDGVEALCAACKAVSSEVSELEQQLKRKAAEYRDQLEDFLKVRSDLTSLVADIVKNKDAITAELDRLEFGFRSLYNDAANTAETAQSYADRVLDSVGSLSNGGLSAAPSNILQLYSAATSAPELALLQTNIDRMRTTYRETEDFLRSSKARALLARLGDSLKAMGLDLPFDKMGDQFRIDDSMLKNIDISKIFRNFGGMKMNGLFNGVKMPEGLDRYVSLSHDFDRKAARAWVQVDVNLPVNGTRTLFEVGPFRANLKNSVMQGVVRLEASKDSNRVQETGNAEISTAIELQVSGQTMVTLEQVALRFSKEGGMDFEFDPKRIRLNPSFQFIQDTLGQLFPDEFGGMQVIKQNGIPVGLEHVFNMPPVSLNYGTSGLSNIAITNRFKLVAFPEFVIADQFILCRPELPFIFSIFIIGGTGYIQIDTEYRPFEKLLSVSVEAAVGGSAAFAFAFGPVAGGVYISLSVTLRYRKLIGAPGGGLSVGTVLVIAGLVSLWGMVTVMLTLSLRMTYHDDGKINATGSLSVEVRISRFFRLKFRRTVIYQLRGGKTTKSVQSEVSSEVDPELRKKAERLEKLRKPA